VTHRLVDVRTPSAPEGVVVVLHGGAQRRERTMVSPTQLSVVRMIPVARRVARAGRGRLAVVRLLNSWRGWDSESTPLDDAAWALEQVARRWPGLPVALVVHGDQDRIALPERARAVAARLSRSADVEFVEVEGGKHAMLRHGRRFESETASFVVRRLVGGRG
jgi:pimeloyl-ACP methyl ester carboxylesterase